MSESGLEGWRPEIVAGELRSASIKIDPWACRELLDEMAILQWLPDQGNSEDPVLFGVDRAQPPLRFFAPAAPDRRSFWQKLRDAYAAAWEGFRYGPPDR